MLSRVYHVMHTKLYFLFCFRLVSLQKQTEITIIRLSFDQTSYDFDNVLLCE